MKNTTEILSKDKNSIVDMEYKKKDIVSFIF